MYIHTNKNVKMVDTSLVNKILEQGQKLRNAMVGSILKNDPFNTDIIYSKHFNTPISTTSDLNIKSANRIKPTDEKTLEAYIKGEYLTRDEEKLALDTLRSMSAPDLCKTTERTLNSNCLSNCKCYTCEIYNSNNIYCDLRRKNGFANNTTSNSVNDVTRNIQEKYENQNRNLLKYVDSLKVAINSVILNESGNLKVTENAKKVPYAFNQTYFLEYCIPDCIIDKSISSKSKVNSGLEKNYVRFCSRRSNGPIIFKQITIHDIKHLDKFSLDECDIHFKINYRTQQQKHVSTLGFAKFNLGSFLFSKNLVCNRSLPIFLNENSPIVVGNLKVSLLLGCGRLYFGQEFIDAINSVKRESVVLDSDDSTSQLNQIPNYIASLKNSDNFREQPQHNIFDEEKKSIGEKTKLVSTRKTSETFSQSASSKSTKEHGEIEETKQNKIDKNSKKEQNRAGYKRSKDEQTVKISLSNKIVKQQISENEKQILFGFLYISEAQYLSPAINTYVTCRPFCQSETSCSKLITDTSNPIFNLSQLIPLIYEDELLQLFRENYMVIEFWKKIDSTQLVIGLTKISLHQFYLAYRNPIFVKYLSKNKLPIIDTDWWEPIYSIDTNDILGQVQILLALGTEEQINNLKSDRGFANDVVKRNVTSRLAEKTNVYKPYSTYKIGQEENRRDLLQLRREKKFDRTINNEISVRNKLETAHKFSNFIDKAVNTSLSPKTVPSPLTKKFDVGIQSDIEMDKDTEDKDKHNPTQEMLGTFLNQLMGQKQRNIFVENGTNTDPIESNTNCNQSLQDAQNNTNVTLKKTTDLLDSLQKALSLDGPTNLKSIEKKPGTFKAAIKINSANHLPNRKKCKSKKSRSRSVKNDDNNLPSCYVTFETSENNVTVTPVILKTTNPTWNYKCETDLPEDFLTNSQRRLIFKVWRKTTNTVSTANMDTDIVLGFAAVDLSILLSGFPNVQGWFNIIDFTGKCNGQINIHITPLENLTKYTLRKEECNCDNKSTEDATDATKSEDEPSEVFSRALKRKFSELDEITQRLRLRLSKVTNHDSDTSSDGFVDEFEKDINNLCIEEDFDLINFNEEAMKLNLNYNKQNVRIENSTEEPLLTMEEKCVDSRTDDLHVIEEKTSSSNTAISLSEAAGDVLGSGSYSDREKELSSLDKHLQEGKQKIDTLLEKLSLISADTNNTFASRYVSGCSLNNDYNAINIDTEAILKELDHSSRPNILSSLGFEPLKFQQLYGGSEGSSTSLKNSGSSTSHTFNSNSDTSIITNLSESRPAPDGEGNISDEKVAKK